MEEEKLEIVGPMEEPLMGNIVPEEINDGDSLSSSDSEKPDSPVPIINAPIYRMFDRERPVHMVLGGGKPADVLLWRDKKVTEGLLGVVTVIWLLFGFGGCRLLTFICRGSILFLLLSFLWSNALNKSPESIVEVYIPEKPLLQAASVLTFELNCAIATLRSIALERDIMSFAMALVGLWIVSIIGTWFSFVSLVYICFVLIHTVPMLYEKFEDEIDPIAEKFVIEMKKHYQVFEAKVLMSMFYKEFEDEIDLIAKKRERESASSSKGKLPNVDRFREAMSSANAAMRSPIFSIMLDIGEGQVSQNTIKILELKYNELNTSWSSFTVVQCRVIAN